MNLPIRRLALLILVVILTPFTPNWRTPFTTPQVLAQTSEAQKSDADRLFQQGAVHYQTSQFEAAFQSWQQALTLYREIRDRAGEGQCLNNLGLVYRNLGDNTKAIEYHQQSLAIAREIKNPDLEGSALGSLGNVYFNLGDLTQAIEYHQQSLAISRQLNNRQSEAITLNNLGNAYFSLGDYTQAIQVFEQSLAIARELNDRRSEGNALGNLGTAYDSLGNYTKAIESQEQSLAIAREINDRLGEAQTFINLGLTYRNLGDYAKAIEYQQQSLAIAREIQDPYSEAQALGNLSNAYYSMGDYAKAIEYQQQSLALAKKFNDRVGEEQSLGNLGNAYYSLGDYTKAIELYQQQLALARELQARQGEANALGNLGNAYSDLGDYTKAIEYQEQSLAIAREIKDRAGESSALGNLGLAYYYLKNYPKAIQLLEESLANKREIKDSVGKANTLGNLGLTYHALGDYGKAIEYQQQYLAIAREINYRWGESTALNSLGAAFRSAGKLAEAQKSFLDAINVRESLRAGLEDTQKVSIFETQTDAYQNLQETLILQNKIEPALEIAERGRARAFVELLTQRLSSNSAATSTSNLPTLAQIKQIAKTQNATLVEYSLIYDKILFIWVIKPTGEVAFRRVELQPFLQGKSLEDLIKESRESIGVRGRGLTVLAREPEPGETNKLHQLYQFLIEPIADLLPTNPEERVIFLPQSSLFLVSFASLQDASGKYLIEKHTILTAPSIQVLDLTHRQRQQISGKDILVVGNPTMPSIAPAVGKPPEPLPSLPGAEKEALAIAQLLNTKAITGDGATKAAILQKISSARIIHLATHGLLDNIEGIGSAIALAPSGNDDGLLTAQQILNLKLNAELVVLSACDTGRGRITGDGVIGLSRSLISAGVPSVLVSLWSIPDAPTASLMTEFYRNLQHNDDKAQALRQAMLTTMKQHSDPRDWAAFTLIGEAE